MGALEDIIFQSLGGAAKPDFTAGDPYAEPNQFVTQTLQTPILQAALKPDRGGYGTGELIGGALISGLLGGGLSGLSKDYQTEQKDLYRDYVLGNLFGKTAEASPELDPSLFDVGKSNLDIFNTLSSLEGNRAKAQTQADLGKTALEAAVKSDDPAQVLANARALGVKVPGAPEPAIVEPGTEGAPINPLNKKFKANEEMIDSLREKFNALPDVKDFRVSLKAAQSLSGALKDNSAVSDQELVRRAIQMIEPGMAVREGEASAVASSQSIPEAWRGALASALDGKSKLGEDVRAGIGRLAERAYSAHKSNYEKALAGYRQEATYKGLNPDRVDYLGDLPDAATIFGSGGGGFVEITNPKTGTKLKIPANDPRLKLLGTPRG